MFSLKHPNAILPTRATAGSAGYDMVGISIKKSYGHVIMIETGVCVNIPDNHVGLLVERSSLHKKGYTLANSVGVIDSDYKDTIKICLLKFDRGAENIELPERIVQLVIVPYFSGETVDKERNGGFGST